MILIKLIFNVYLYNLSVYKLLYLTYSIHIRKISKSNGNYTFRQNNKNLLFVSNVDFGSLGAVGDDLRLFARGYSRNTPEFDVINATLNNPSTLFQGFSNRFPFPKHLQMKQMEELLKRKIQMNDLKKFWFRAPIEQSEFHETEELYIPPFRAGDGSEGDDIDGGKEFKRHIKDDKVKLIGRDIDFIRDGKIVVEKGKYKFEDVLCQTLIASLLEYDEITKFHSTLIKHPTQDIIEHIELLNETGKSDEKLEELKELVDFKTFITDEHHLPVFLHNFEPNPESSFELGISAMKGIMKNLRIFLQISNNSSLNDDKFYTKLLNLHDDDELKLDRWTEYLNNVLLSYMYKYSKVESSNAKLSEEEIQYDLVYAYLNLAESKYLKTLELKRDFYLTNKYIDFNLNDRNIKRSDKIMPYWIWYEFWRNRDNFMYENLYDLLKEVVITDPFINLGKLTKGFNKPLYSFKMLTKPKVRDMNWMLRQIVDVYNVDSNKHVKEVQDLIDKYTPSSEREDLLCKEPKKIDTIDLDKIIDNITKTYYRKGMDKVTEDNISYDVNISHLLHKQNEEDDKGSEFTIDDVKKSEDVDDKGYKSLGYELRNLLSFDNFEKEYEKFNLKQFGTRDYGIKMGQLVKGKVYKVTRTRLIVDIHAHAMGVLHLRNFYETPSDVPIGGFLKEFKKGDELMFEVSETWDRQIVLSLKKIRTMHRFRKIFENKDNVFLVKVLQRYTKGVFVQFVDNPDSTDDFQDFDDIDNTGFIPIECLSKKYRNKDTIIDINLVNKVIPVVFDRFDYLNKVAMLNNKAAVTGMQLMYLRPGDIVKGNVKEFEPYHLKIKFGEIDGILHVDDMNAECYRQHLVTYPRSIIAQVKYIDYDKGLVILSNRDIYDLDDRKLLNTNQFIHQYFQHTLEENIAKYREFVKTKGELDKGEGELEVMKATPEGVVEWNLVGDKLLENPANKTYNRKYNWYIKVDNNWLLFPQQIQDVLNYNYHINDVTYFTYENDLYKVLYDKNVMYTVKKDGEHAFEIKSKQINM